ncbi:MAG: DUF1284 domain-containing protein [Pseudomonadota bacterium]
MLTFQGHGYTPGFTENMKRVVSEIRAGRPISLVDGPDDICAGLTAKCRADVDHDCTAAKINGLDTVAIKDVSRVLDRDLRVANPISENELNLLRQAYRNGDIRAACESCRWKPLCDVISTEGFQETVLAT